MNGFIVIGTSMLLSVAGLLIVRRGVSVAWLRRHHEAASHFFVMVGTLYAVLIAFAVFVVWTESKEAGTNLEHETTEVADLSRFLPLCLTRCAERSPALSWNISTAWSRRSFRICSKARTASAPGLRFNVCGMCVEAVSPNRWVAGTSPSR